MATSSSTAVSCRVLLRQGSIAEITLDIASPAKECIHLICKKHDLDKYDDIEALNLTILTRPLSVGGRLGIPLAAEDRLLPFLSNGTFVPHLDILDLCVKPVLVRVISDGATKSFNDAFPVLIDYYRPLHEQLPILRHALALSDEDLFSFELRSEISTWLNSRRALSDVNFSIESSYLVLYSVNSLFKRFKELVVKGSPDKFGCMFKQSSGRDVFHWYGEQVAAKDLTKKKRRWFMLKDTFLAYFKNAQDETPAGIVPLDYYVMRISDERAKEKCLILERRSEVSNIRSTSSYLVFTVDEGLEAELRDWYQRMAPQCVNTGSSRIFGQSLHSQLNARRWRPYLLPPIVSRTISFVDQHGLETEGIFRLSGNANEVFQYKELFDCGDIVQFDPSMSPHVAANLLKAWCRELPDPLLPSEMYSQFIEACLKHDTDIPGRYAAVLKLLDSVPLENLRVLQSICSLLKRVSKFESVNKMGLPNLSLVFGPNVLRSERDLDPILMLRDTPVINEVMQILTNNDLYMEDVIHRKIASGAEPASPSAIPRAAWADGKRDRLQRTRVDSAHPPTLNTWQAPHRPAAVADNQNASHPMTLTRAPSQPLTNATTTIISPRAASIQPDMDSTYSSGQAFTFTAGDYIRRSSTIATDFKPSAPIAEPPATMLSPRNDDSRKARRGAKFEMNELFAALQTSGPDFPAERATISGDSFEYSPRMTSTVVPTPQPTFPVVSAAAAASPPPVQQVSEPAPPLTLEQEVQTLKVSVKSLESALAAEVAARRDLEAKLALVLQRLQM